MRKDKRLLQVGETILAVAIEVGESLKITIIRPIIFSVAVSHILPFYVICAILYKPSLHIHTSVLIASITTVNN